MARKAEKVSDMERVRRAVNDLGLDATTQQVHDHIKQHDGKDVDKNKISAYKSILRRQAGVTKSRHGRRGGRPASAKPSALRVEDVHVIKELVGRLGADKVRELIGVFHGRTRTPTRSTSAGSGSLACAWGRSRHESFADVRDAGLRRVAARAEHEHAAGTAVEAAQWDQLAAAQRTGRPVDGRRRL
jgi:hypothetical protein